MYNNPVKDWFYFTRRERQGIIMLLILIVLIPFLSQILEGCKRNQTIDMHSFFKEVQEFEDRLAGLKELSQQQKQSGRRTVRSSGRSPAEELQITPFPFDPNTLSPTEWDSMGVPAYLWRTIGNYLSAGGSFRYKEDLKRIYVMENEVYRQLEPFIQLPDRSAGYMRSEGAADAKEGEGQSRQAGLSGEEHSQPIEDINYSKRYTREQKILTININQADSTEIQKISGIGPVFSRRIIRYRELLGGYHCTSQLLEVFGMDSVRFDQIKAHMIADTINIRRLDLNQAAFTDLVRHPYIDRPVANAILNLREQHGPFIVAEDIKQSYLIDEAVWYKIAPYVTTE